MAFQIKVNKINTTRSISDLIGIAISFICAVQCAMAPIILSIAPVIPGWAHFGHGWIWISLIFILLYGALAEVISSIRIPMSYGSPVLD